ncbi:hypothetical protein [Candidatus Mycoplasma pogonae]
MQLPKYSCQIKQKNGNKWKKAQRLMSLFASKTKSKYVGIEGTTAKFSLITCLLHKQVMIKSKTKKRLFNYKN